MRCLRLTILIASLALATACIGSGSHAGMGVGASVGGAFVPTGVTGGTTTTVSYQENGGLVVRSILSVLAVLSAAPRTRTSVQTSRNTSCVGSSCTVIETTTTTTTVLDSPAQMQAKAARAGRMLSALRSSAVPVDFRLDIATPSLGGDTSGWLSTMMFQASPWILNEDVFLQFSGGMGFGSMSFADRQFKGLVVMDGGLQEASVDYDAKYSYAGMPLRLEGTIGGRGLMFYGQADLNIIAFVDALFADDDDPEAAASPSPMRFGLEQHVGPLSFGLGAIVSRFREDGISGLVEVSLVL